MNKTVNINLAGIFFHIDEDAYLKLHRYLEAIKRSFTDAQGRSEIIADIEARIAELFYERIQNDRQVIGLKEVNEVITIMGQPEDFMIDDAFFDDGPSSTNQHKYSKKLYRDNDNSYVGGVAAGLGHYIGIDAVWIRLIWILLALGSGGTFIFIYVLLWILVPEALTTADKLTMRGEPVNISNIEKKIKNEIENVSQNVSEAIENIDLPKQKNRIKSGTKSFFGVLGEIIHFFLRIIGKFIGILLLIIGASVLIALIVSLFSVGIADILRIPSIDLIEATNLANIPIWAMSVLLLLTLGIPFFFVFYLGLKILVKNLNSLGQIAKFSLLGLWLITLIGLVIIGAKQSVEYTEQATVTQTYHTSFKALDTLYVTMSQRNPYSQQLDRRKNIWKPVYDENEQKLLYLTKVKLSIKTTKDSIATISINKSAYGNTYQNAKINADHVNYNYTLDGNNLVLDQFLTTAYKNKYRGQTVEISIYLPQDLIIFADKNIRYYYNSQFYTNNDLPIWDKEEQYLQVLNNGVKCSDCPEKEGIKDQNTNFNPISDTIEPKKSAVEVIIDQDGINIKSNN